MKLIKVLTLIAVLSSFTALKISSRNRIRNRSAAPADNIIYQFTLGFLAALSGQPKFIDECSQQVPGWEAAAPEEESNNNTERELGGETSSTLQKVLGYLGVAIDAICNFKDKIIAFLTKRYRRYMRLFMQGKTTKRFKWSLSGMWDTIKGTVTDIGNAVVKGAKAVGTTVIKAGQWVGKKVDDLYTFVKEEINKILEPIYKEFEKIKVKFLAWLERNPMMKKLFLFAKCFITNGGVKGIKTLYNAVKSIVELIPKLGTPAGWIELLVNLVCGWESLKDGIGFLTQGLNQADKKKKYNLYGRFLGKIFEAIAG